MEKVLLDAGVILETIRVYISKYILVLFTFYLSNSHISKPNTRWRITKFLLWFTGEEAAFCRAIV